MHIGHAKHTPSPDDRTIVVCGKCGWHTKDMTKEELGAFGVPWYCERCDVVMTRFATFAPHERYEALTILGITQPDAISRVLLARLPPASRSE